MNENGIDLKPLLRIEYRIEREFFIQKMGSGDKYRELISNKDIVEFLDEICERTFFTLSEDFIKKNKDIKLDEKKIIEYNEKFIQYYTQENEKSNDNFDDFYLNAYRYINLVGHYANLDRLDDIFKILKDRAFTLFKWGYGSYLKSIIKDLKKKIDHSELHDNYKKEVRECEILYKTENVDLITEEERLKVVERVYVDSTGVLKKLSKLILSRISKEIQTENNDKSDKDTLEKFFNSNNEMILFIGYNILKILKKDSVVSEMIANLASGSYYGSFYGNLLLKESFKMDDSDGIEKSLLEDDPFYLMLFSSSMLSQKCLFIKDVTDLECEEIIDIFVKGHELSRKLKFDCFDYYIKISSLFIKLVELDRREEIIDIIEKILENGTVKTHRQGNSYLKNISCLHKQQYDDIEEAKNRTKYDDLFDSYKSLVM